MATGMELREDGFIFDGQMCSFEMAYDLYAVRRTVCQMLQDRGYILPPQDQEELTFGNFQERFHGLECKHLTVLAEKEADSEQKIYCFFPVPDSQAKTRKISVDAVKEIIKLMYKDSVNRSIIIVEKPLLGHAQMLLDQETEKQKLSGNAEWRIEIFLQGELKVNITKHELVPRHKILTDDEKRTLLKRYHLQEKHLPRIQKADPIARYYGLERRTVIKIVRPSETAGWYVTYRLVA